MSLHAPQVTTAVEVKCYITVKLHGSTYSLTRDEARALRDALTRELGDATPPSHPIQRSPQSPWQYDVDSGLVPR